jgi:hypothetical protein
MGLNLGLFRQMGDYISFDFCEGLSDGFPGLVLQENEDFGADFSDGGS